MKCSDKFVLLYPVGSLMSSMMDSTDVKLYLCETKCTVKAATKFACVSGLRLHMIFFLNIVSLSFLSRLPEFIHILALLFLLSCYWSQDLAETPISRFCISRCLSTALFSLLVVCQHLLTDGKGWSMVKLRGCYKGKQRWCLVQFIKFFAVWKLGYMYSID